MQQDPDRYFYEMVLLALVLTFQPLASIGLVLPIICFTWFLLRSRSGLLLKRTVLVLFGLTILLAFYNFIGMFAKEPFVISNGLLSFINYSSFLVILLLPVTNVSGKYTYERYAKLFLWVLFVQGGYGIIQRVLGTQFGHSNGDIVEGTINPFSFLHGTVGFGNQYFAINISLMLLFCFPYVFIKKRGLISFALGVIVLLLASVGHVFFSLLFALFTTYLLMAGPGILFRPKTAFALILLPAAMLLLLFQLDASVFYGASRQASMFLGGSTPKAKAIEVVQSEVGPAYPYLYLIGLGPGQYSSRAGLLASGTYGRMPELNLDLEMTAYFRQYVYPAWNDVNTNTEAFGNSTMYRPFFSLLSVYTEFGGLFFLFIAILLIRQAIHQRWLYHKLKITDDPFIRLLSFVNLASVFFLIFISLYENYLETPQGIFIGLLLITLSHNRVVKTQIKFGKQELKSTGIK